MLSSRLVMDKKGQFAVVGEVPNNDADPADLTMRATIYDESGKELTWYNAADVAIHKALPYEVVPFRVNFEGVAGEALTNASAALVFEPGASFAYQLPADANLGAYNVFAKAVTTPYDLDRAVGAQDLRFELDEKGALTLHGQLFNSGLQEAAIPHVLVTLYNAQGRVAWVDQHFLRESVGPLRTLDFNMPLTPAEEASTCWHCLTRLSRPG